MNIKRVAFFTVADENYIQLAENLERSLYKFHPGAELQIVGQKELAEIDHRTKFYIMTPLIARQLIKDYDLVIKLDADQIITGDLSHIWEDETYDLGCVLNGNRVDPKKYNFPLTVWDIAPQRYMNCGFVAMRSQELIEHWWSLCVRSNLKAYRFAEQDMLNILYHYGNYEVKCFDDGNMWHGLISKGEWHNFKVKDGKLFLPVVKDYPDEEKEIKCIHAGGGHHKKFDFKTQFSPEVSAYLKKLVGTDG